MNAAFWQRLHGGSTHLPIVLLPLSVAFDFVATRSREPSLQRGFHAAGFATAVFGVAGGSAAVVAGLVMSRGEWLGSGIEKLHHLYVWPAFMLSLALVACRLIRRAAVVKNGIKGQMSRFNQKLTDTEVRSPTAFLRSLNGAVEGVAHFVPRDP